MARIRTIKPEFPQSESMGRVSRESRLCFILLWTLADDSGRLRGNSRMLASLLYPYDDDAGSLVELWLNALEKEGCIVCYEIGSDHYIQVCNWLIHQKIDHPSKSKIPPPLENSLKISNSLECSCEDQGRDQGLDQGSKEGIKEPPADSDLKISTIANRHPKNAKPQPTEFAICTQLDRLMKVKGMAPDQAMLYLLERTTIYAAAIKRWPSSELKFVPEAHNWFNDASFEADERLWEYEPKSGPSEGMHNGNGHRLPEQNWSLPAGIYEQQGVDAWKVIKGGLHETVSPHTFSTWLKPTQGGGVMGTTLYVKIPAPEFGHIGEKWKTEIAKLMPAGIESVKFVAPEEKIG